MKGKWFYLISTVLSFFGMSLQSATAQELYYEYLYNISANGMHVKLERLESYSPFQFSFDEKKNKAFLTDAQGVFDYSYFVTENGLRVYKEDKAGPFGTRILYFSPDFLELQWDCPEDYFDEDEKNPTKTIRALQAINQ